MKWSLSIFLFNGRGVRLMAAAALLSAMPITIASAARRVEQEQSVKAGSTPEATPDKAAPKKKLIARKQGTVMKFFRLVNQTGAEIKVRVLADGHELFVKRLEAAVEKSPGIAHPYEAQYPTLELKIPLSDQARQLSIQESLFLKKRKRFDISVSPDKAGAGFQIVIGKSGIVVTQDYYPIR
jgi:hypothetical protein